jgi:hypothetical protein
MPHRHKLNPWAVFRLQANLRHVCVARFRKRSDAEHYEALRMNQARCGLWVIHKRYYTIYTPTK